jgi:hypothetical protein
MLHRLKIASLFGFALLIVATSSAQTTTDLRQKYGPPDENGRYTVHRGVMLSVSAENGKIRLMRIDPDDSMPEAGRGSKLIAVAEANAVIDELAPAAQRGKHIRSIVFKVRCSSVAAEEYDQVMISISATECSENGGITSASIRWKR